MPKTNSKSLVIEVLHILDLFCHCIEVCFAPLIVYNRGLIVGQPVFLLAIFHIVEDVRKLGSLQKFRGEIMQVPPMYSALKINGQKLVDLARKGKEVERKPRPVTIHELTLLGMEADGIRLRVRCSKGTYIRTLCKDIGEALGCGGCMAALRRVSAGEYTIEEAVPLQQLLECEHPEIHLRNLDTLFLQHPKVVLTANQEKRCRNGGTFSVTWPEGTYRAYSQSGEFLMLAKIENGVMSTIKSFFAV